jgi:hypothetical protein
MKRGIIIVVCFVVGVGVGWYCRHVTDVWRDMVGMRKEVREYTGKLNEEIVAIDKMRAEQLQEAAPWEASTASIALAALKNLDTNNVQDARFRLAAMVATYYRGHNSDGDTNLIIRIENFAKTDSVLSNALYKKFSQY